MATELGQAYVQIMPSAKGIKGKIAGVLDPEAKSAGTSAGSTIASFASKAIIVAGIGKALTASIKEGAKLEQSIGGIETLFKQSSDRMLAYAKQSYKTAGLSSNEYMETATSFAASLLQSLGGDTKKAADISNMAIIDMSDNANKMGTNMRDIQNAYQGFAKQNYTMLDNLKLGYGGTKTEMQRLLQDAEKLSGKKYDISNLNDVFEAIHVIQGELDITGTTAKEAEETLSGSFNSMKAAAQDFMGNLALGEDIRPSLEALIETTGTFLFNNLLPAIGNILMQLPIIIAEGIFNGLPALAENMENVATTISTFASEKLPLLIPKGIEAIQNFVEGMLNNLPAVLSGIGQILGALLTAIIQNLPQFLIGAGQIILTMARGIADNLPSILSTMGQLIGRLAATIIANLPQFIAAAVRLIGAMAIGIIRAIPQVVMAVPEVIAGIVRGFTSYDWGSIGHNVIRGIANGITSAVSWVVDAAKRAAKAAFDAAKNFLGIHSPSRKFMWIGDMSMKGLAKGIDANSSQVYSAMATVTDSLTDGVEKDIKFNAQASTTLQRQVVTSNSEADQRTEQMSYINELMTQLGELLKNQKIEWNDRELGRMVNAYAR